MTGLKAQIKKFLKAKGIKTIQNESGKTFRLGNATTNDLLKVASKYGF